MPKDIDLLQGTWTVIALEVDGQTTPAAMLAEARIEIEGDRFTSIGMGADYAGTVALKATAKPRQIDMKFDTGPEAGNVNRGIYRLKGSEWKICLATRGDVRPAKFATQPGSGFALETLNRGTSKAAKKKPKPAATSASIASTVPATELEGEWRMVSGNINGVAMEDSLAQWVKRVTRGNISTVLAGPQVMLKVEFTCDPSQAPKAIDYLNLAGPNKGKKQQGIYAFEGDLLKFCVSPPSAARPTKFHSEKGDGRTFTVWKKA